MVCSPDTSELRMAGAEPLSNVARSEGMFISAPNEFDARTACMARLETFADCPAGMLIHVRPADLAAAGFEYVQRGGLVRCSCCGVEIRDWKKGDEPVVVHQSRSRNCRFLLENFVSSESSCDVVTSVICASSLADSQDGASATPDGARSRLSDIQTENKIMREKITCKICRVESMQTLFLPCRHLAVCEHCAERLDNCCVCQEKILGTVRVVMVPKIS